MFILINIPCWDIQCSTLECANITHSLIGHYLAGNISKVDVQCPPMECANNCTLHNWTVSFWSCQESQKSSRVPGVIRVVTESSESSQKSSESLMVCPSESHQRIFSSKTWGGPLLILLTYIGQIILSRSLYVAWFMSACLISRILRTRVANQVFEPRGYPD